MATFVCGICTSSFNSFLTFLKHNYEHLAKDQTLKCPFCPRSLPQGNSLVAHLRNSHFIDVGFEHILLTVPLSPAEQENLHQSGFVLGKTVKNVVNINCKKSMKKSTQQQLSTENRKNESANSKLTSNALDEANCKAVPPSNKNMGQIIKSSENELLLSNTDGIDLNSSEATIVHLQSASLLNLESVTEPNTHQGNNEPDVKTPTNKTLTDSALVLKTSQSDSHYSCPRVTQVTNEDNLEKNCVSQVSTLNETVEKEPVPESSHQLLTYITNQTDTYTNANFSIATQPLLNISNLDSSADSFIPTCPAITEIKFTGKNGNHNMKEGLIIDPQESSTSVHTSLLLEHVQNQSKGKSSKISDCFYADFSKNTQNIDFKERNMTNITDIYRSSNKGTIEKDFRSCENFNNSQPIGKRKQQSEPIDFHFLLGSVCVERNSMTNDRTEFRCLHCQFSTSWRPSLVKHMKGVHGAILDIHCILEIKNAKSIVKDNEDSPHTKFRNNFKVLKMSDYLIAHKKAKTKPHRSRKLEYQDVPGQYSCLICHKVFPRLRYLRRHKIVHGNERSHLCDLCGKCFKTRAVLVSHKCTNVDKQRKSYSCPQCSFTSCSRAAIHKHRQLHPCGSLLCDVCGAVYPDRSSLRRHARVHDPSRPFACSHFGCTWRFKTQVMCRAHERGHSLSQNASKFQCSFCGYNFRQKHHLQRHIAKFHNSQQDTPSEMKSTPSSPFQSSSHSLSAGLCQDPEQNLSPSHRAIHLAEMSMNISKVINRNSYSQGDQGLKPIKLFNQSDQKETETQVHDLQSLPLIGNSNRALNPPDHSYPSIYFHDHNVFLDSHPSTAKEDLMLLQSVEESKKGKVKAQGESLEILQGQVDLVKLLKPGQTLIACDQHGNLVHYKVTEIGGW